MTTTFKAPQKPLKSSWKEISFKAPKRRGVSVTTTSKLGHTPKLVKIQGVYVKGGNLRNNNMY